MDLDRRGVFVLAFATAGLLALGRTEAEPAVPFDPVAFAKLRAGEIARAIESSPRNGSVPAPSHDATFDTGLLLQAGLRALLPVNERQGVALPGSPSAKDPAELVEAQENYKSVFESGAEASERQKATAVRAIRSATRQLETSGYAQFARGISDWARTQGYAP